MKRLLSVISLVVLASLVLSACGATPAATPTATQAPALAPTETPAATETPVPTVAPAATETPAPTETAVATEVPTLAPTETTVATEVPTAAPTETAAAATGTPAPAGVVVVPGTPAPASAAPGGALVAVAADVAPTLDGVGDEDAWAGAEEISVAVAGGANFDGGSTEVRIKALYTDDSVYFLVTYADPTMSFFRSPWLMREDGTWEMITDPDDRGGDNNTVYEDKLSFIWPIANSIPDFDRMGCFSTCHAGENPDVKPYGNKYTDEEGQLGDIWHWKSVRNLNQVDDQYLDWTRFNPETALGAGRKSDPRESGGYVDNVAADDTTRPGFTSPNIDMQTGAPGYILDSERVEIDPAAISAGSYIPSIIKSEFVGDRGDISAGWKYEDGMWTLEFGRALVTGSDVDVQFDDLNAVYYFGVAAFDNAQVRHAFQRGVSALVFQPR